MSAIPVSIVQRREISRQPTTSTTSADRPSPGDKKCWVLHRAGLSDEEIGARLSLKPDEVKTAIQGFEAARASAHNEVVDMIVNTEALVALDGVGEDLREARQGLRFTGAYDRDGSPIYDRDFTLMLDSVAQLGSLLEKTRPKGGGVQINTAIQNNGRDNGGNGSGQGRSFEAMLREAKAQRVLTDGGVVVADDGPTDDIIDADTDEDIQDGVELDDPDKVDDDEQDNGE